MSAHAGERLSAYLDGALSRGERAEVESHLAVCDACAGLLARMAAIDSALRARPGLEPEGDETAFVARVRARIERQPRPDGRRSMWPVWTWAVAAALVLAVVTPLALRESPLTADLPERGGGPRGPQAPPSSALQGPTLEREGSKLEAPARVQTEAAPAQNHPADLARREVRQATPPSALAPAPASPPAPARQESKGARGAEESAEREQAAVPSVGQPQLGYADSGSDAALGTPQEAATRSPEPASADGREARVAGGVEPAAPAGRAGGRVGPRDEPRLRASLESNEADRHQVLGDAARVDALAAVRPQTAEEWRSLRQAWADLAARLSDPARADEARLRAVEASHAAWRVSRSADDRERFERDAREYVSRTDARQKARVQRLLVQR